ncbi:hypothetical protein U9M48_005965 [Paspalum notatum var. saurae]|uniref:Uncharacterized protein n=1 Tax=Paspalum notatum var. saurae TaxID=547442 RepID=A0AAQ3PTC1_PASNO
MANSGGYGWALAAGFNAALAAISAKFFASLLLKYGMVILFNVTMWGCYVNSLKALSSLQATVTNFATNFISSGLAGCFLFHEPLPSKVSKIMRELPQVMVQPAPSRCSGDFTLTISAATTREEAQISCAFNMID